MEIEKLKEKVLKEFVVEDQENWKLAQQIFEENVNILKPGVTVERIYDKIIKEIDNSQSL